MSRKDQPPLIREGIVVRAGKGFDADDPQHVHQVDQVELASEVALEALIGVIEHQVSDLHPTLEVWRLK